MVSQSEEFQMMAVKAYERAPYKYIVMADAIRTSSVHKKPTGLRPV